MFTKLMYSMYSLYVKCIGEKRMAYIVHKRLSGELYIPYMLFQYMLISSQLNMYSAF